MPRTTIAQCLAAMLALWPATFGKADEPAGDAAQAPVAAATENTQDDRLPSVEEARSRAALLHETMHATLQIVHHEYFREEETIPAATLKRVFREIAKAQRVEMKWLAVNAQAMNVDHKAQDAFEKQAVQAIATGRDSFELAGNGRYRRAGVITLTSDCLKCHLPNRTSTKSRAAALVISIPIANP